MKLQSLLALLVGGLLLQPVQVALAADAPQPAIKTGRAAKALLTDVVRAGERLVAVGERGHIIWSDDKGSTWQQAEVPTRSLLTAVYFPTAELGWATGHDSTILHSADGGKSWQLQHRVQFDPAGLAAADDTAADEEIAYDEEFVEDESAARGDAAEARKGAPLLDVWFADAKRGLAVGAYGLLLVTDDGGKTWADSSSRLGNGEGWHINAIAGVSGAPDLVFIAGERGLLMRSQDAGQTFQPLRSPFEGSWFGLLGASRDDVLLFGLQGKFFRSADLGNSWQQVQTDVTTGLNDGVVLDNGGVVIAGNAGVVLSSADGKLFRMLRRSDRQTVMSAAPAGAGVVLVGEGGSKPARADGSNP